MTVHYALDFGTTNSVLASDLHGGVSVVTLSDAAAERMRTPVVPTAVCFADPPSNCLIGQLAIDQNLYGRLPNFAQGFKRRLGRDSRATVAALGSKNFTAKHAGETFFDGLRQSIRRELKPRRQGLFGLWDDFQDHRHPLLSDLTLTAPVDADEMYRRQLISFGKRLGARSLRVVDEPVAAALGYGVNVSRELMVLVVDWGGGTLDVSVVRTGPQTLLNGRAEVLAKSAAPLGGDDVDYWIASKYLVPLSNYITHFDVDAKNAAASAKETASIEGEAYFRFRTMPPRPFNQQDLKSLLTDKGAYETLRRTINEALDQLTNRHGLDKSAIDEALLVGGSSLLPGVDETVRSVLPTTRVSEWNVFSAVAEGACEYARGGHVSDQIYHDYALRMADDSTRSVYYELIFPAQTTYPTIDDPVHRHYTADPGSPTELLFEVCEIARLGRTPIAWQDDSNGRRTWRPAEPSEHDRAVVINQDQTSLKLPPNRAFDRRLSISYTMDEDRYLRWTVVDGKTTLKDNEVLGRLR
jgi:molecular chaperone DnaK (HSP70)